MILVNCFLQKRPVSRNSDTERSGCFDSLADYAALFCRSTDTSFPLQIPSSTPRITVQSSMPIALRR